jgi:voltage-gated potassium channel
MAENNPLKKPSLKEKVWEIVEATERDDRPSKRYDYFDIFILVLILLNAAAVVLETVEVLERQYRNYFLWFEIFSVIIFTIEYLARVWASTSRKKFSRPFWGRVKFMLTPMALIDLLAILPFYLTVVTYDLRFIRTLRIFRLLRLMKLVRYSASINLFGKVLKKRREELIVTASIVIVMMILSASFIYFAEHEAQPEAFPDIPSSMWWAIVTLTTVGYGDVYPTTVLGKMFAAIIAMLGIGMFALPTGILGASFVEELENQRKEKSGELEVVVCPHCGEKVE